jgi:hypothetical protein
MEIIARLPKMPTERRHQVGRGDEPTGVLVETKTADPPAMRPQPVKGQSPASSSCDHNRTEIAPGDSGTDRASADRVRREHGGRRPVPRRSGRFSAGRAFPLRSVLALGIVAAALWSAVLWQERQRGLLDEVQVGSGSLRVARAPMIGSDGSATTHQ